MLSVEEDQFLYLFLFKENFKNFKLFDFESMKEELDQQRKWYFYYEIHNDLMKSPLLTIIKTFDRFSYNLEEVQVLDGENYYTEDFEELIPIHINKEQYQIYFQKEIKNLQLLNSMPNKSFNKMNHYTDSNELVFVLIKKET